MKIDGARLMGIARCHMDWPVDLMERTGRCGVCGEVPAVVEGSAELKSVADQ